MELPKKKISKIFSREEVTEAESTIPSHYFTSKNGFSFKITNFANPSYFRELMEAYPNAKVVLTVRDPVRWYNSVKSSIFTMRRVSEGFATKMFFKLVGAEVFNDMVLNISNHKKEGKLLISYNTSMTHT